jgi:hypothetical protein
LLCRPALDSPIAEANVMPRVLIEIYEGQIVRNLLENRLLDVLAEAGSDVLVVTPGARVPSFLARFERPGVAFRDLSARPPDRWEQYELSLGQQLLQGGRKGLRRALGRHVGERLAVRSGPLAVGLIDEWGPDVVVSTHVSQVYGRGLVAAARRRGIPTLGNLNSWDNAYKGLKVFPDRITCWSENNKEEVCRTAGYEPDDVAVIGAPAFDAYLAPDSHWSREELAGRIGLDARRPILLFATLGQFQQNIDETNPLEVLLREADAGRIPGDPQVVLRMHPWSRDVYFGALMRHSRVTVSRYENYVPGLTWTPTRQEAVLAGNLLRHADVVITPGSTMSIEPAIFDTPTVVPVFNEYMPEVFESYFRRTWLDQHFKALHDHGWVPIVRSGEEMTAAINRALRDPTWNRSGQARIREVYLGPLDGRATERFAEQIVRTASRSPIA